MNAVNYIEETSRGMQVIPLESTLLTDRRLFLDEPITARTAVAFTQAMLFLTRTDQPIHIYINCTGGEVNAGLAIYDLLQSCPNEITMYCIGQACSMAAIILAAGQKGRRFILPHSRIMIHEVLLNGSVSGSATSISRISDSILETRKLLNSILAEHTGKTIEEIERATAFDNFMNAEEAIIFGICDAIAKRIDHRKEGHHV